MRTYIKNKKFIELVVPFSALTTDVTLKGLVQQGLVLDLATDRFTENDIEYKVVYFNFLEDELLRYLISAYEVNWLRGTNTPFIELPKDTVIDEVGDDETKGFFIYTQLENDTHKLIGLYAGTKTTPLNPNTEVLLQWAAKYGIQNIYCDPVTITEKRSNYENI